MVTSVRVVVLVRNLDRSVPFYRDVLGLTPASEHESTAFFQEGVALHEHPDVVTDDDLRMNAIMLSLVVSDIPSTMGKATEHGCPILVPSTDVGDAVTATISDPDGNAIQLVQPSAT